MPAKGAPGGRVKANMRVVVSDVFFFKRVIVYREKGGIYQSPICELAGGLIRWCGGSGVMADSNCWENSVALNIVVARGVLVAATNANGEEIVDAEWADAKGERVHRGVKRNGLTWEN